MPRWIPGKQNGKPMSVRFQLPISFKITDEDSADLKLLKETLKGNLSQKEKSDDFIYDIGSCDMPVFPGGDDALKAFLKENLEYPNSALKYNIEGNVRVSFIVEKDGSITNAIIVSDEILGFGLEEEALRIVKLMPKWNSESNRKYSTRTKLTLPISFKIPKSD